MACRKNSKYLSLYPEDFVDDIWNQVCDVVGIPTSSKEVRIFFDQEDIWSEFPEDDDLYEDE